MPIGEGASGETSGDRCGRATDNLRNDFPEIELNLNMKKEQCQALLLNY